MLHRASVDRLDAAPSALSRIGGRFGSGPAIAFALLSLFFGSAIIVVNPPLRGPGELSHFLRIYSYTRGEILPVTEINGRKGIFVERGLYERLHFFKYWGESLSPSLQQHQDDSFGRSREQSVRCGHVTNKCH